MKNVFFTKKKYIHGSAGILLAGVLLLGMTGCASDMPELTKEEEQAIGEYAAVTMLKYDANHRSRLVDLSLYPEDSVDNAGWTVPERPEPDEAPGEDEGVTETPDKPDDLLPFQEVTQLPNQPEESAPVSMEEFMELPVGVTINYTGYKVMESYPEDSDIASFFSMSANEGKVFLVENFLLENRSNQEVELNVMSKNLVFKTIVNKSTTKTALVTMLTDDLSTFLGTLTPGSSQNVVLLYEISESMGDDIQSLSLILKNESNSQTISLK